MANSHRVNTENTHLETLDLHNNTTGFTGWDQVFEGHPLWSVKTALNAAHSTHNLLWYTTVLTSQASLGHS